MRSTRATAAIARLNARSAGHHYTMALTGSGLFILRERLAGEDCPLSPALTLDEFVQLVDSMGLKKEVRITRSETAFMKHLFRNEGVPVAGAPRRGSTDATAILKRLLALAVAQCSREAQRSASGRSVSSHKVARSPDPL